MPRAARFARLKRLSNSPYAARTIQYGRRYLSDFPDDSLAWLFVGIALAEVARYEEAEQAFGHSLENCPIENRHYPLLQLGHLHREAGNYDQAIEWYRRAIVERPNAAHLHS